MHAIEFLRQRLEGGAAPVYALFGDDAYLRRESERAIVRAALGPDADDYSVSRFAGDKASLADVLDELRMLPFLSRCRVVAVDDADKFVTAHRAELEQYVGHPAQTGVLVLGVKSWPSNTKLAKLLAQRGEAIECKTPAERTLPGWLVELAASRFGARLHEDAARLLLELVGPEVSLLASEVEKLATYVGERAQIDRKDVAKLVGAGRVETIWKTVDAAAAGETTVALEHLGRLVESGEYPVALLGAMAFTLRRLYHAGQLRMAHKEVEEACKEAGMHTFPGAIQNTLKQHKHLGPGRVGRLPKLLLRADLDLKGSSGLEPRVVLERLLVQLARPRQEVER